MAKKKQVCPKCHSTHYGNIKFCVCGEKLGSAVGDLLEKMGKDTFGDMFGGKATK